MSLKYRYQEYQVGRHRIRLRTLRNLDQYTQTGGAAEAAGISREAFPLFGIVWGSAEVLANLLIKEQLSHKRILEVGCGMGLASHLLNALGNDVTAMDIHPITQDLLDDNAALNNQRPISFCQGSWSDETLQLGSFDLIIGSDILYEPKHVKHLAGFLDRHLEAAGEVVIVDPDRGQSETFVMDMEKLGFLTAISQPEFIDELGIPYDGSIFRFTRS